MQEGNGRCGNAQDQSLLACETLACEENSREEPFPDMAEVVPTCETIPVNDKAASAGTPRPL